MPSTQGGTHHGWHALRNEGRVISQPIEGAFDSAGAELANVGIDHGRGNIGVTEEFLRVNPVTIGWTDVLPSQGTTCLRPLRPDRIEF